MALVALLSAIGVCQAQQGTDTLKLARQLRDKAKYKKEAKLLQTYINGHTADYNARWLNGQAEYWLGHLRKSQRLYAVADKMKPNDDYLQLDYAKVLADAGKWKKALAILEAIKKRGKNYTDGEFVKAKIDYWKGDYKLAEAEVNDVLWRDGLNKAAVDLRNEILRAKSPWLQPGLSYWHDSQPLQYITPSMQAGVWLNRYAQLLVSFYSPVFIRSPNTASAQLLQAGDAAYFSGIGLLAKADIGIAKFPAHNTVDWTGNIYLQETLLRHLVIEAQAEHKPYLSTLISLDTVVHVNHYAAGVGWNNMNSVNGKVGFDMNAFTDNNYVYSIYGWVFAPPMHFSIVKISIGYGYSYSDSKQSRYTATEPLTQIIADYATAYPATPAIAGVYNPYFTPHEQNIHSILLNIVIKPVKALTIYLNGGIGFYAYTQNPYLYLDKNSSGEVYIARGFSRETYLPASAGATISWQLTKKVSIGAQYAYNRTFFYTSNYAGINLKLSFWNDKKA